MVDRDLQTLLLGQPQHVVAFFHGEAHGLFQQQVLAGGKHGGGHLVMQAIGYDDIDHIQVVALDQFPIVADYNSVVCLLRHLP